MIFYRKKKKKNVVGKNFFSKNCKNFLSVEKKIITKKKKVNLGPISMGSKWSKTPIKKFWWDIFKNEAGRKVGRGGVCESLNRTDPTFLLN